MGTLEEVDVSVIEIPFDAGVTFESAGVWSNARRAVSVCLCRYSPALHVKPSEVLSCVGRGDVSIGPGNIERSYEAVERYLAPLADAAATPLVLGGDHSISLARPRAM